MRKTVLSILLLSLTAVWFVACGSSSSKPVVVQPQTTSFVFMQQAPSAGNYMFSPVLGTFSTTSGVTTFSTKNYVDKTTNQPIAVDIGSIVLSADGKKATFDLYGGLSDTSSNQWDIWVANADGTGNPVQITNDIYEDYLPQFSPNGTKIVYASYQPVPTDLTTYQWQIVVVNSDGTGTAQVLPIPEGVDYQTHPTYSPDGTKLAMEAHGYANGAEFWGILLTKADGTNAQWLSSPYLSEACYSCADELPSFTADGSIIFSRDNWNGAEFEDLYIMNLDGSNPTKLTDSVGINSDPQVVNVSGAGTRILFSSNRDNLSAGTGGFDIYSAKLDGTNITRLTSNTLYDGFSEWWYGDAAAAAVRHSKPGSRVHTMHGGLAAPHGVRW